MTYVANYEWIGPQHSPRQALASALIEWDGKEAGLEAAKVSAFLNVPYPQQARVIQLHADKAAREQLWKELIPTSIEMLRGEGIRLLIAKCNRKVFRALYRPRGWKELGTQEEECLGNLMLIGLDIA